MSVLVVFLEVFLLFALYPAILWFVLKYLLEEYPILNYLKLLSIPLVITLLILGFTILKDSTRVAVVFLVEGPNKAQWLGEQIPHISKLLLYGWLLLPITVRFISLTDSRDYYVLKRKTKKIMRKLRGKNSKSSSRKKSKKRSESKESDS